MYEDSNNISMSKRRRVVACFRVKRFETCFYTGKNIKVFSFLVSQKGLGLAILSDWMLSICLVFCRSSGLCQQHQVSSDSLQCLGTTSGRLCAVQPLKRSKNSVGKMFVVAEALSRTLVSPPGLQTWPERQSV